MKQSRLVSIIEVSLNVVSGFILAMLVWKFVIPVLFPRMAGPVAENFVITLTFTVFSVVRAYFWRRFFNNGIHATVANWVGRLWGSGSPGEEPVKFVGTKKMTYPWGPASDHYQGVNHEDRGCVCVNCLNTRMRIEDELGD